MSLDTTRQEYKKAPSESDALAVANNHLAIDFHRLLAEEKKNVFFSPFSISTAMAMVYFAAEGKTAAELISALGYDAGTEKNNLATLMQRQTLDFLKRQDTYTLTSANSMLLQKDFLVKDDYKSILDKSFKALLLEVDFQADTKRIVQQINNWVEEKTKGMISNLIEALDPNTIMVVLNAVYFKGSWLKTFDENQTSDCEFYNYGDLEKEKVTDMMTMKDDFLYGETDSYQVLQLPYLGEDTAMMILLPIIRDGLEAVEASLTSNCIQELNKSMQKREVMVALPRFRLEYSKSLVPFFKKLGVERLFRPGAELGGASDSGELVVSDVIHKAVLEVNEEGSEAAAGCFVQTLGPAEDPFFIVDHPFVFFIYNTKNNLILFMGRVEEL